MMLKKLLWLSLCVAVLGSCAKPLARFTIPDTDRSAPSRVQFINDSEGAESYLWDFGDGTQSTDSMPEHRYVLSGNYLVTLHAIKGGKKTSMTERIKIDAPEDCLVHIQTPHGDMIVKLYDDTPLHRDNFLKRAEQGYYDSLLYHRVINGFMIQGGDPDSRNATASTRLGTGGPGYKVKSEISSGHIHKKGALAAARQPDTVNPERKSSGSQFYIVHGKSLDEQAIKQTEARSGQRYSPEQKAMYIEQGGTPFLDGNYTVFGEVIEGLEVIDAIAGQPVGMNDRPVEDIWMRVEIIK